MSSPAGIPAAPVAEAVLQHFASLMRHVAGWHAPDFLGVDVTMSQAKCLYVVALHPDISMTAMAEQLHVGLSSASGLVDRLVEHGYLERHEDPTDRRQQLLSLTPAGVSVVERIRELNAEFLASLLQRLSADELEALRFGIAALAREARAINPAPPAPATPSSERNPA